MPPKDDMKKPQSNSEVSHVSPRRNSENPGKLPDWADDLTTHYSTYYYLSDIIVALAYDDQWKATVFEVIAKQIAHHG